MSNILFVFEGERTEKQITDNLTKYFINENTIVQCAYCNDVYELYKEIVGDEDLDTFALLKQIPQNQGILSEYKRVDFAEIYLFFDYDGHDNWADDDNLREVINFFNEETERGKIFISYPMIEALKHYSDSIDFQHLTVKAKENIRYKKMVGDQAKNELKQIKKYTKAIWVQLIEIHLKKMNFIINDVFELPANQISQIDIFLKQLEKFIRRDARVAVLSAFPVFLFDYYGYKYISNLLSE